MLARCSGSALRGLEAVEVNVEVDIGPGLPGLQLVGLPDAAVQEARERVRAALRNSGLKVPLTRIVVSLRGPRGVHQWRGGQASSGETMRTPWWNGSWWR